MLSGPRFYNGLAFVQHFAEHAGIASAIATRYLGSKCAAIEDSSAPLAWLVRTGGCVSSRESTRDQLFFEIANLSFQPRECVMLVLTRKQNEKIRIGSSIVITVVRMKGKAVRLGIEAPGDVNILRGELAFETPASNAKEENAEAEPSVARPRRTSTCHWPVERTTSRPLAEKAGVRTP